MLHDRLLKEQLNVLLLVEWPYASLTVSTMVASLWIDSIELPLPENVSSNAS